MARLDRTLERFIREAEGGGAFDPYTLAKALDDAVAAPPEAAGEAVAPLVRFVDWAVRSGHNEGIDPASRASAARLAEFDQAGANPRNLPAFLAGVLAAAALFQLAPRDESQEPPASRRRDAARALLAAAEAWSDEATLIFARMLWDLHRPGGEFFGGGKVRAGEEDTRRQVLASLHSRWPAGAVREILGRVLARALGVRVREDASASPRELPRGVAEAIGL
ncbi:MAG TPA: hypothetical protein PKW35_10470, partial [Nannocystaceae bacterium]|nr:hypothetical protein [Nannocystaceae bacterium]